MTVSKSASASTLFLILLFRSGFFTTVNYSTLTFEFHSYYSGALMRIEAIASETLRQPMCRFDLTQPLGEISGVPSSSMVSHERRLLHPGMFIPCCSFAEGCGCSCRNSDLDEFCEAWPAVL